MNFRDAKNNRYQTDGEPLGKGGEGSVYRVKGNNRVVLKIFSPKNPKELKPEEILKEKKRAENRYKKLLFMTEHPLQSQSFQAAWPISVVFDDYSEFAGYLMPRIKVEDDLNFAEPRFTYSFAKRIRIAANLCAALHSIHEAGYVCGDLNPNNIIVNPNNGGIILIDCDSYHVTDWEQGVIYRCEVGMPDYLPPELQAKMKNGFTLSMAPFPTFTVESDLFALAVHIFKLLMKGSHPFACKIDNSMDIDRPEPTDNICNGFFPFHESKPGLTIPSYAPNFSILPRSVRNLFCKAFIDGLPNPKARPKISEWFEVLKKMEKRLSKCSQNPQHFFSDHLKSCPWCKFDSTRTNSAAKQYNIGNNFYNETGFGKNLKTAIYGYEQAAKQGDSDAQYQLAECYYKGQGCEKDLGKAVYWYKKVWRKLDESLLCKIGDAYYYGKEVEKNLQEATYWYKKVWWKLDDSLLCEIGDAYYYGKEIEKDLQEARKWYERAKSKKAPTAFKIGDCYYAENCFEKAVRWYTKAFQEGSADAAKALNLCFSKGIDIEIETLCNLAECYYDGHLVSRNLGEAAKLYAVVATHGKVEAQYRLGNCYYKGEGFEKNFKISAYWYEKAAEQDYSDAQYKLGICYYNGEGVEKNFSEAVKWWLRAAEHFNSRIRDVLCKLGDCYYNGIGVEKNLNEAIKWYSKAYSVDKSVLYKIGNHYYYGKGIEKDLEKACCYYKKAAGRECPEAEKKVGDCYYYGKGVSKDREKAKEWYLEAARHNFADARKMLGKMLKPRWEEIEVKRKKDLKIPFIRDEILRKIEDDTKKKEKQKQILANVLCFFISLFASLFFVHHDSGLILSAQMDSSLLNFILSTCAFALVVPLLLWWLYYFTKFKFVEAASSCFYYTRAMFGHIGGSAIFSYLIIKLMYSFFDINIDERFLFYPILFILSILFFIFNVLKKGNFKQIVTMELFLWFFYIMCEISWLRIISTIFFGAIFLYVFYDNGIDRKPCGTNLLRTIYCLFFMINVAVIMPNFKIRPDFEWLNSIIQKGSAVVAVEKRNS